MGLIGTGRKEVILMAHKNNEQNLRVPTSEEARRNGRKGGQASAASRRAVKTFKEALIEGLTAEEQQVMLKALKRNAMRGNLPSFEFLLKMEGQHPDQVQNESDTNITININGADDYGD